MAVIILGVFSFGLWKLSLKTVVAGPSCPSSFVHTVLLFLHIYFNYRLEFHKRADLFDSCQLMLSTVLRLSKPCLSWASWREMIENICHGFKQGVSGLASVLFVVLIYLSICLSVHLFIFTISNLAVLLNFLLISDSALHNISVIFFFSNLEVYLLRLLFLNWAHWNK